jgi:uncharacterized membrane-anchored protein
MKAPETRGSGLAGLVARLAEVPSWVWLASALVVQTAIIGSLVVTHYTTATTGKAVFLRIAPADPRDPLRGDYLSFTYDISRIDTGLFVTPPKKGRTVYVGLSREGGPLWAVTGQVLDKRPDPRRSLEEMGFPPATVFLRGVVQDPGTIDPGSGLTEARVVYGIEEYFVPEGMAARFPVATQDAVGKVLVDKDGKGLLGQVYLKGVPWP